MHIKREKCYVGTRSTKTHGTQFIEWHNNKINNNKKLATTAAMIVVIKALKAHYGSPNSSACRLCRSRCEGTDDDRDDNNGSGNNDNDEIKKRSGRMYCHYLSVLQSIHIHIYTTLKSCRMYVKIDFDAFDAYVKILIRILP